MKRLIHFVGMQRSGNHAVIPWLQNNVFREADNGTAVHVNDVFPIYSARPLRIFEPPNMSVVYSSPKVNVLIILSYEDLPLSLIPRLPTVEHEDSVLRDATSQTFLLLRDPFNAFASRLKRIRELQGEDDSATQQYWQTTVELWKSYAKEYLGETNILGDIVPVNYNLWVTNKDYRDNLLREQFGQEENLDIGINGVSVTGEGSSFTGTAYDGKASEMDVTGRWKHFIDDPFYQSLCQDPEIHNLSERIFGHINGTEILYPTSEIETMQINSRIERL